MVDQVIDNNTLYCDVQDVSRYLRGYNINSSTNPSETEVESFIEARTEYIESQLDTAFRTVSNKNVPKEADLSYDQKRDRLRRRSARRADNILNPVADDRITKINLPNDRIKSLEKLVTKTQRGERDILSNTDKWDLTKRNGTIRIDIDQFKDTSTGKFGENRFRDARIITTYIYGRERIPKDIQEACAKLVIADLVNSDQYGEILPNQTDSVEPNQYAQRMKDDAHEILSKYPNGDANN